MQRAQSEVPRTLNSQLSTFNSIERKGHEDAKSAK